MCPYIPFTEAPSDTVVLAAAPLFRRPRVERQALKPIEEKEVPQPMTKKNQVRTLTICLPVGRQLTLHIPAANSSSQSCHLRCHTGGHERSLHAKKEDSDWKAYRSQGTSNTRTALFSRSSLKSRAMHLEKTNQAGQSELQHRQSWHLRGSKRRTA